MKKKKNCMFEECHYHATIRGTYENGEHWSSCRIHWKLIKRGIKES